MRHSIAVVLLAAGLSCAHAQDPASPAEPAPPEASAPAESADQAALETSELAGPSDAEPAHTGPTWGQSRVERYREKCRALADEKGLQGSARQQHMQSCVKR
jgi:hypothetical protein